MRIKTKCNAFYRNGDACKKDAVIRGKCVTHLFGEKDKDNYNNVEKIISTAYQMGIDGKSKKDLNKYIQDIMNIYKFSKR